MLDRKRGGLRPVSPALQRLSVPTAEATEMYWRLHGEMQKRYLADLLQLQEAVRELGMMPVALPPAVSHASSTARPSLLLATAAVWPSCTLVCTLRS